MLTHSACRARFGRFFAYAFALTNIAALAFVSSCDKVPLVAPTGSVITLIATSDFVGVTGETEIIATVIENGTASPAPTPPTTPAPGTPPSTPTTPSVSPRPGAGTPVQNGTLVSFTTTLGRIEPREARTHNGEVRVKFIANGQSGTAQITAFSGGAVGTLSNGLRVGAAAAGRVILTTSPSSLCGTGGTVQVLARVETTAGVPLAGIPVTFSADQGSLSATSVVTDASGTATVSLTTARETTVLANAAGQTEAKAVVRLNARTGVTIAGPTTQISAGVPATFTIGVATGAVIRDVSVDFGDGDRLGLGPISGNTTVSHTYDESGTYTARATATDAVCGPETVSTAVTILPGQPPAVTVTASNNNPTVGETVIFTATVSGATSTILRYEWNFGAGAIPDAIVTTGNRATATYTTPGTKIITVRVVQAAGPEGEGSTAIVVRAGG
jgi:Bacterial Ig-like domain (group 1)/PKD domain